MKILLVMILTLGSMTAFAQRYGGSTYYGYGTISMSDAVVSQHQNTGSAKFRIYYYPFVENTVEVVVDNEYVCTTGLLEYGNRTTSLLKNMKLSYLENQSCSEASDYIAVSVEVGSEWLLDKNAKPHFSGTVMTVDLVKNVEAKRCVSLKELRKVVQKINKKNKRDKCSESSISVNGEIVNI